MAPPPPPPPLFLELKALPAKMAATQHHCPTTVAACLPACRHAGYSAARLLCSALPCSALLPGLAVLLSAGSLPAEQEQEQS